MKGKAWQHKWRKENPGQSKSDRNGKRVIKEVLEEMGYKAFEDTAVVIPPVYDEINGSRS
jgi:hypothetical protein